MQPLNYHHLLYFYKVAKLGSIARASAELKLTQPTISEQIRLLEKSLGQPLFDRVGRSLVLTEAGKTVSAYAEKIFALGTELTRSLDGNAVPATLRIGVDPRLSSRVVAALLPASPFETVISDENPDLTITPVPAKDHSKLLECGTVFLSRRKQTLKQAALLLPPEPMRSALQSWLKKKKLAPKIVATFDSDDLLFAYAERSDAIFVAPDYTPALPKGFHVVARVRDLQYTVFATTKDRRKLGKLLNQSR